MGSSTAEQTTIAFSFDLNDNYTLRYNFGDTDNFSDVQVDQDQANRIASADDPFTAADADVPLVDEEKHVLYDYTERSHEVQLVSNLDGPLNFIVGAFTYENYSAWFVPFYVHTQPWVNVSMSTTPLVPLASPVVARTPLPSLPVSLGQPRRRKQRLNAASPGTTGPVREGTDHSLFLDFQVIGSSETQAAFVNAEYQLSDQWMVSGGLRYTEDEKSQDLNGGVAIFLIPLRWALPPCNLFRRSRTPSSNLGEDHWAHLSGTHPGRESLDLRAHFDRIPSRQFPDQIRCASEDWSRRRR